MMKKFTFLIAIVLTATGWLKAQSLTDGLMMTKGAFCTGFLYTHDQWKNYWEGELKRDNQNIGNITTKSLTWVGNYGVTDRLNIIVMAPYVTTKASSGTLQGLKGMQDLSVAIKYRFFAKDFATGGLKAFAIGYTSTPLTNYTPDYLPLSIGMASTNLAGRLTLNYHLNRGWYINGSSGYLLRSNVTLDRPSYYTNGKITFSNEVQLPNAFDFLVNIGYLKKGFQVELTYSQQNTLGGGDIRRQDMPFVSNRMNFSKASALVMYYLPNLKNLAVRGSAGYTVAGRNVGQSTTLMAGVLYTFNFFKTEKPIVE